MAGSAVAASAQKKGISEIIVGASFLGIVALLIVPVPSAALDFLLALSLAIAAVVFLTALFSERPTDFSIFPTLLLISTLLRLSLNIASTRLILRDGQNGPEAAGKLIMAFSQFVVGGSLGVGLVIFLALVIINFVVITKGAGRIAEVSARFTLDAMPGKQMAIDAELNAGAIDEAQARKRRAEVEQQANFYGAMDGSNKFIRGDAVAGLIITAINLVGGLAIGVLEHGLSISDAIKLYPQLTIGDGLVSQMPALVVSSAAGIAITRASGKSQIGREILNQMLGMQSVLNVASGFLVLVGLLPGLPVLPFFSLAAALQGGGWWLKKSAAAEAQAEAAEEQTAAPVQKEETMADVLRVDPIVLEVGYGLLPLVDASRGGDIPERVRRLRKQMAQEMGLVIPSVRVIDNLQLQANTYIIRMFGAEVAQGELLADQKMALDTTGDSTIEGVATREPVYGLRAFWIPPTREAEAAAKGMAVVDASTVLSTHMADILRKNADQLIGRDQVSELVEFLHGEAPKLVDALNAKDTSAGLLLSVLRGLLKEGVSIRNLRLIVETIVANLGRLEDPVQLTERVRAALWRQISQEIADDSGVIYAIVLDGATEQTLRASFAPNGQLIPDVTIFQRLIRQTIDTVEKASAERNTPCLVLADDLRRPLRDLIEGQLPDIPFVAVREIDRHAELRVVGTISAAA